MPLACGAGHSCDNQLGACHWPAVSANNSQLERAAGLPNGGHLVVPRQLGTEAIRVSHGRPGKVKTPVATDLRVGRSQLERAALACGVGHSSQSERATLDCGVGHSRDIEDFVTTDRGKPLVVRAEST